jgi:hypothetical protein
MAFRIACQAPVAANLLNGVGGVHANESLATVAGSARPSAGPRPAERSSVGAAYFMNLTRKA